MDSAITRSCTRQPCLAERLLDDPVEHGDAMFRAAHRGQDLPTLGLERRFGGVAAPEEGSAVVSCCAPRLHSKPTSSSGPSRSSSFTTRPSSFAFRSSSSVQDSKRISSISSVSRRFQISSAAVATLSTECIRTCCGRWMCANPTRSGPWTSRISRWHAVLFISRRYSIGTHGECWRGGYRYRWTRRFASKQLKRRALRARLEPLSSFGGRKS